MKVLIGVLLLALSCSTYAAEIKRNVVQPKGKPTTVIVDKKPMKHKEKMEVRKELQSGKKKCYSAYDKRKNKSYVICEGGK